MVSLNRLKKVVVLTLTTKGKNKNLPHILEGILKLSGYALPNTSWVVLHDFPHDQCGGGEWLSEYSSVRLSGWLQNSNKLN